MECCGRTGGVWDGCVARHPCRIAPIAKSLQRFSCLVKRARPGPGCLDLRQCRRVGGLLAREQPEPFEHRGDARKERRCYPADQGGRVRKNRSHIHALDRTVRIQGRRTGSAIHDVLVGASNFHDTFRTVQCNCAEFAGNREDVASLNPIERNATGPVTPFTRDRLSGCLSENGRVRSSDLAIAVMPIVVSRQVKRDSGLESAEIKMPKLHGSCGEVAPLEMHLARCCANARDGRCALNVRIRHTATIEVEYPVVAEQGTLVHRRAQHHSRSVDNLDVLEANRTQERQRLGERQGVPVTNTVEEWHYTGRPIDCVQPHTPIRVANGLRYVYRLDQTYAVEQIRERLKRGHESDIDVAEFGSGARVLRCQPHCRLDDVGRARLPIKRIDGVPCVPNEIVRLPFASTCVPVQIPLKQDTDSLAVAANVGVVDDVDIAGAIVVDLVVGGGIRRERCECAGCLRADERAAVCQCPVNVVV